MPTTPQTYSLSGKHEAPTMYSSAYKATNASTLVKTGKGVLHSVVINTKGATANTLTLYDGIDNTGTVVAIIDTTLAQVVLTYDIAFATGLYATLATGTAANVTITYL